MLEVHRGRTLGQALNCDVLSVDAKASIRNCINMDSFLKKLGVKIRSRRKDLGLSQEEFASTTNFDRTYISLLERGKRNISIQNLLRVSEGLEVPLYELIKEVQDGA